MILVDYRVGSRELLELFRNLGVQVELDKLETDFQFVGNGPDGEVLVGVERKAIQDLLTSMRDRRLAGSQIGKMQATYDVCCIVVEGTWRRGKGTGLIEVPIGSRGEWIAVQGSFRYSEVSRFLTSLRRLAGIDIWRTANKEETAAWVVEEYSWWQKAWSEHKTGQTIYIPEPKVTNGHRPIVFRRKASLVERWVSQLPGIDAQSSEIAKNFSSGRDLANSEVDRWLLIAGIGKVKAKQIIEEIEGHGSGH